MPATKELVLDEMVSIDQVVEKILLFSNDLVHADRCTINLVNEEENELFTDYFYEDLSKDGEEMFSTKKQIKGSCNKGIDGHVFKTGQPVIVYDAYRDIHFNGEIDEITGYQTNSILAYPILK